MNAAVKTKALEMPLGLSKIASIAVILQTHPTGFTKYIFAQLAELIF